MLPFDPKKPLYGFKMRAPHAKRRIHLFADEGAVYFRPKNASGDWIAVLPIPPHIYDYVKQQEYLPVAQGWITDLLKQNRFFRVFWLSDVREGEARTWEVQWHPEIGYVFPTELCEGCSGAYFWPRQSARKLSPWHSNTEVIKGHFMAEWNDSQSDVRAALPWCDMSFYPPATERQWNSIKWLRGGRQELVTVLRAAYKCESQWPEENPVLVNLTFSPNKPPALNGCIFPPNFVWKIRPDHRLGRMISRLCERNYGVYDFVLGMRQNWLAIWLNDPSPYSQLEQIAVSVRIIPPTQHERMEASLFLRNWLRDNAPDLLTDWFPNAPS